MEDFKGNDCFIKTQKLSTDDLFKLVVNENDNDKYWTIIGQIQSRGCLDIFNKTQGLSLSRNLKNRIIAADILGQLRTGKNQVFHEESVIILLKLLNDIDDNIIASAAFSLGHRNDKRAIVPLLTLINHKNNYIREGVVSGLSNHEDKHAIKGLIQLSKDSDNDIQNWAVFGLASLCDSDTEEIRTALLSQLDNKNAEIRGEAMIGLAKRQDKRIKTAIIKELKNLTDGYWVLDAVIEMPHIDYVNPLKKLILRMEKHKEYGRHIKDANDALDACLSY